jgi:hypothetical protein
MNIGGICGFVCDEDGCFLCWRAGMECVSALCGTGTFLTSLYMYTCTQIPD